MKTKLAVELVLAEEMHKGDYIAYTPTYSSYLPNHDNTGVEYKRPLFTELKNDWIINSIDIDAGKMFLRTVDAVNFYQIELSGIVGFVRGPKEIHKICEKLYSNNQIGAIARSILYTEIIKNSKWINLKTYHYAYFYGNPTNDSEIEYNGKLYKKVFCDYIPKFYFADGGGVLKKGKNGLVYHIPTNNKPVFITESISSSHSIIKCSNPFIIPSTYISSMAYNEIAYNIRVADTNNSIFGRHLAYLNRDCGKVSYGIMPIVEIDLHTMIYCDNNDGTINKPWQIVMK